MKRQRPYRSLRTAACEDGLEVNRDESFRGGASLMVETATWVDAGIPDTRETISNASRVSGPAVTAKSGYLHAVPARREGSRRASVRELPSLEVTIPRARTSGGQQKATNDTRA